MRLLFVCSENRWRSPTAEAVFSRYDDVEAIGAGTNRDAPTPVSGDLIEWADIVFAMEQSHKDRICRRFGKILRKKRVIVLGIADRYRYMQPELVVQLEARVKRSVRLG